MKEETVKVKECYRRFLQSPDLKIERAAEGKPRTLTFSASSEEHIDRWFGVEVLAHEKAAVRMDRAKGGAMPLLFNHNVNDPRGMISKAWLEHSRLMVESSLFETSAADELERMINGGLRNVSIAYRIHKIEENKDSEVYRVTDWEPFEVSIVTVPADPTVGIGREYDVRMVSLDCRPGEITAEIPATLTRGDVMPEEKKETAAVAVVEGNGRKELTPSEYEARRVKAIESLCKMNRLDEKFQQMFIGQGLSVEDVSEECLKIVEKRGETNPQSLAKLGLNRAEADQFSILRAVKAIVDGGNWNNAPFELECSRAVQTKLGRPADPHRFFIPFEVMERQMPVMRSRYDRPGTSQRDLVVATPSAGGYLVETTHQGFIDMLRNRAVAFRMGARRLSGLVGNVTIPRQTTAGTVYWLATEATAITESTPAFDQVALTPNTAGAYMELSRLLLLQSNPSAEGIVTNDLSAILALGVDLAVLAGTGTEQPQGIIGTAGVGSVTGSPAGTINYASALEFQTDVAAANVMPQSGGYVTTPAVAALAMQRARFSNTDTPIWVGNVWDGTMCGFPAMSSMQMPAATMIFGDWSEVIVAEWGVLEVEVNPYANFQAGIIGIRAMYTVDVGVKRPAAFSTMAVII